MNQNITGLILDSSLSPVLPKVFEGVKNDYSIDSKNTDKSLDEWRRVKTNVDESQTNVDECRRM